MSEPHVKLNVAIIISKIQTFHMFNFDIFESIYVNVIMQINVGSTLVLKIAS